MKQSYPHQIEGAEWLDDHPKAILADEMRLGKTRTTLLSLLKYGRLVIICPSSAKSVWRDEIHELDRSRVVDTVQGRSHEFRKDADVLIVNYDVLCDHLSARRFPRRWLGCALAVDECHRAKSMEAKRTRATQFFVENAARAVCLSGTPMPSRTAELYPVLSAVGAIRMDQTAFERRYSAAWKAPWGWDARGASNLDELRDTLRPYLLRRTKQQVFGRYVPYESRIITFDREPDARESEFVLSALSARDNPLISISGLSEVVKESGLRKVPDAIEFIEDRIRESETGKVCVFFWHKEVGQALARGLSRHKPLFITGDSNHTFRASVRARFRLDEHAIAGGNILAAGEAIDLSIADTSIFVETSWVSKDIRQAAERTESMAKLGQQSTAYFLTLENSLDHHMLRRVLEKETIIDHVVTRTVTTEELLKWE